MAESIGQHCSGSGVCKSAFRVMGNTASGSELKKNESHTCRETIDSRHALYTIAAGGHISPPISNHLLSLAWRACSRSDSAGSALQEEFKTSYQLFSRLAIEIKNNSSETRLVRSS